MVRTEPKIPRTLPKDKCYHCIFYCIRSSLRSTEQGFDQNLALQAACATSIARVTGCLYPREGYRSVTHSPANARVNRTKTFSPVVRTETV